MLIALKVLDDDLLYAHSLGFFILNSKFKGESRFILISNYFLAGLLSRYFTITLVLKNSVDEL